MKKLFLFSIIFFLIIPHLYSMEPAAPSTILIKKLIIGKIKNLDVYVRQEGNKPLSDTKTTHTLIIATDEDNNTSSILERIKKSSKKTTFKGKL